LMQLLFGGWHSSGAAGCSSRHRARPATGAQRDLDDACCGIEAAAGGAGF
jgi:hypothetical protein